MLDARLLDESNGLVLSTLPFDDTCVFSGDKITDGEARVYLAVLPSKTAGSHGANQHTVSVSVESVTPLVDSLTQATFDDTASTEIVGSDGVAYAKPDAQGCCCVCQNEVVSQSVGFGGENAPIRCHVECVPTLVDGLRNVWEHTDEILGDRI